jgi:hypothetical protein
MSAYGSLADMTLATVNVRLCRLAVVPGWSFGFRFES